MGVILPKINLMRVEGFDKIFKEDIVEINFSKSLNILLGGNGLGKTTLKAVRWKRIALILCVGNVENHLPINLLVEREFIAMTNAARYG